MCSHKNEKKNNRSKKFMFAKYVFHRVYSHHLQIHSNNKKIHIVFINNLQSYMQHKLLHYAPQQVRGVDFFFHLSRTIDVTIHSY